MMESVTSSNTFFLSARNRLLGWGACMAAIYAIYLFIFPLYPSIHRSKSVLDVEMLLRNGREWLSVLYIAGLVISFVAYWRIMKTVHELSRQDAEAAGLLRRWVLGIGVVCAVLLLGLYPITALDVVLYVVRARLWALYGGSPMMALPANFPQDPYIRFAGEYMKQPSPYGPVWELVAQIPMQLGITAIGPGIIAMKIISLISYLGMATLIGWHARQDSPRYGVSNLTALTFFALNPLVLMQAIGNGHNDMLMLALMTLGLVFWQRGNWLAAVLALTCSSLIKITGFILVPLFGMAVVAAAPDWRTRITRGLGMVLLFVVLTLLAYRLTGPLPEAFSGTRLAMFGRLGYTPSYAVRIFLSKVFSLRLQIIELPTDVGNYLFLLYYLYLLLRLAQRKMTLVEAGFAAYFSQLFLGSTFRIWYPLWLLPFAALNLNSSTYWRTFWFGIAAELSLLFYYLLWRWGLQHWQGAKQLLKRYWDYWLIMTWLTVPWLYGIPILAPRLRRRRDRDRFDNTLWI